MEPAIIDQLYDFSTSFPIDENTCDNIRALARKYIEDTLKMNYYHVMIDGKPVAGKPGLGTAKSRSGSWCNDGADSVAIYEDNQSSYRAQSTFSYLESKPIWVTGIDGKPLHDSDEYIDHWSNAHSSRLPIYRNEQKSDVMTSIVVPLRQGEGHVFGFVCLESNEIVEITSLAKRVLEKMADAIGATLSGYEDHQKKITCTNSAFERIQQSAQQSKFSSPLRKPTVFIASSLHADARVMGTIREVVDKFNNQLQASYWKEDKAVGDISERVQDVISQCRYGICYFSEPNGATDDKRYQYRDNPNVMFEAGMLQSLTASSAAAPMGWIPIREINSPSPPFDFAHMRMVQVRRLGENDQEINTDDLSTELERFLKELLQKFPLQ